ncbi:Plug domain-containing protein [Algoriphagus sp. SE2]|uniref:Plug domain-containing protein n=1 Tax=Algoriphagus sp. SE2 TaxID=3141536 RepID=UPI0031CD00B0
MEEKSFELYGVVVLSDSPDRNVRDPITGVTKLTSRELKSIPAFLGEADIFKGLQMLLGVSSVGEGTSGINVRGAKTDQNLLLMDEAMVLISNHALGFLSAFNTDVTETFTLYKGNLHANFGGRAGSALNIQMRVGKYYTINDLPRPVSGAIVKLIINYPESSSNVLYTETKAGQYEMSTGLDLERAT